MSKDHPFGYIKNMPDHRCNPNRHNRYCHLHHYLSRRCKLPFQVVGRNPPHSIANLANGDDIEVTGTVPDVRPYLDEACAVIVPLRIGGGTRLKIFEAMAMQKAVVSTTIGAEGLPVTSGRDIVIADSPQELADSIARVLTDESWRRQISAAARKLVCERYSAETVARQFEAICEHTVDQRSKDGKR